MSHNNWVNPPSGGVLFGKEIRQIVIAPEGKTLIGIDMPSAHPRLLADFTQNQTFIDAVDGLEEDPETGSYIGEDFHTVNSVLFNLNTIEEVENARKTQAKPLIEKLSKNRKKGKGGSYACVPVDTTEVLTMSGWKRYHELKVGDEVLTMNPLTKEMEYNSIEGIPFFKDEKVTSLQTKHSFFLEATEDHRWLVDKRRYINNERVTSSEFRETKDLNTECSIIRNGKYNLSGSLDITEDEAALLGWILSDGCVSWNKKSTNTSSSGGKKRGVKVVITQAEHKYCKEIEELLTRLGCSTKGVYSIKQGVNSKIRCYGIRAEYFRDFWLKMGFNNLEKHDIDLSSWVQKVSSKCLRSFMNAFFLADGYTDSKGGKHITQNLGKICDGVILGAYLLGYLPTTSKKKGGKCVDIRLIENKRTSLQKVQVTKENRVADVFCLTTKNSTFVMRQGNCITVTGNCLYGGSGAKIALTLGLPKHEGEELKNNFLSGLGLDLLLDEVMVKWNDYRWGNGNYIEVLGGYYVWCSSKHKIINYKALGSEAVVQKIAVILINRKFRKLGLNVKQIINMHDEVLFEVPDEELEVARPLIADMYKEAAKELGLTLDWTSAAKEGKNYYECH